MAGKLTQRSIKFTPAQDAWLADRAAASGTTIAHEVRAIVNATRSNALYDQRALKAVAALAEHVDKLTAAVGKVLAGRQAQGAQS